MSDMVKHDGIPDFDPTHIRVRTHIPEMPFSGIRVILRMCGKKTTGLAGLKPATVFRFIRFAGLFRLFRLLLYLLVVAGLLFDFPAGSIWATGCTTSSEKAVKKKTLAGLAQQIDKRLYYLKNHSI